MDGILAFAMAQDKIRDRKEEDEKLALGNTIIQLRSIMLNLQTLIHQLEDIYNDKTFK